MTFKIVLKFDIVVELQRTFNISSFSKNLISISRIVPNGFSFSFVGSGLSLIKDSVIVGNETQFDGLYRLLFDPSFDHNFLTLHGNVSIKRSIVNEKWSMLWHRRLGHISLERIRRLNDGVLEALDFSNFGVCVDCIKGKQSKKN